MVLLITLMAGISPFLPLTVLSGLLAVVLLIHSPLMLLALLFVVRMSLDYSAQFVSFTLFDVTLSLSQLLGLAIAFLGTLFILRHFRALFHFPLLLPFLVIALWGSMTLIYTISPKATVTELLRFYNLFVIGFLAYSTTTRYRDFRTLLHAIFVSSLIPIAFGLYQFVMGIGLQDENVSIPRIFGTFSHPNVFSLFLFSLVALGTIYVLVYARTERSRLLIVSYLLLVTITLLLTYARIAWIALFVFLGLLALARARMLIVPMLLVPLVLLVFSDTVRDRVSDIFHPTPDSSIVWRQNLWHDMLLKTRFEDRELLGSGMDTFRVSAEGLRGIRFGSNDPHNDFVKFYVEGGVVGVAVLLLYLGSFLFLIARIYWRTPSHSLRHLALLTGFVVFTLLVASLSDNVFKNTPVQWILWTLLGGLLALYQVSLKKSLE